MAPVHVYFISSCLYFLHLCALFPLFCLFTQHLPISLFECLSLLNLFNHLQLFCSHSVHCPLSLLLCIRCSLITSSHRSYTYNLLLHNFTLIHTQSNIQLHGTHHTTLNLVLCINKRYLHKNFFLGLIFYISGLSSSAHRLN